MERHSTRSRTSEMCRDRRAGKERPPSSGNFLRRWPRGLSERSSSRDDFGSFTRVSGCSLGGPRWNRQVRCWTRRGPSSMAAPSSAGDNVFVSHRSQWGHNSGNRKSPGRRACVPTWTWQAVLRVVTAAGSACLLRSDVRGTDNKKCCR